MTSQRPLVRIALLLSWLFLLTSAHARPVVIGTVFDGPSALLTQRASIVRQEVEAITKDEFDVRFPAEKQIDGNWDIATIQNAIEQLMRDRQVSIVIAQGPISSHLLATRDSFAKPSIATIVIDPKIQGVPEKEGTSGVRNLNYITSFKDVSKDFKVFKELAETDKMAMVVDKIFTEGIPQLPQMIEMIGEREQLEITQLAVDPYASQILKQIPQDIRAVMLAPMMRMDEEEFQKLADGFIERKLITFSILGAPEVSKGILAGLAQEKDILRIGRRIALNVQSILLGDNAGTLKTHLAQTERLTVNMETARAIEFYPSRKAIGDAEILHAEVEKVSLVWSLEKVVREALSNNLAIFISQQNVAVGKQLVKQARSQLLPQVDVNVRAREIDDDRAAGSFGLLPERQTSATAFLTQSIYSEDLWASYGIQKYEQIARSEQYQTVRLDVAFESAVAYLNVLRAKTLEIIQQSDVALTRSNLELAKVRREVGYSGPEEVYRWESQLANSEIALLEFEAQRRIAETNLNRALHRPLNERFDTTEESLDDPKILISDPRFRNYIDNDYNYRLFKEFMVKQSLEQAPELKEIEASIKAQQRDLKAARRNMYLPDFTLSGQYTDKISKSGEGSADRPGVNDSEYVIALDLDFPLFTSGAKSADVKRARESLDQFILQKYNTEDLIEQRIRNSMFSTDASYPSIKLSRASADAAHRNLNVVTDKYSRGQVDILDLLDAQDQALESDQDAANAVYDFLIDLVAVQRAAGHYDLMLSMEDRSAWFDRLDEFIASQSGAPSDPTK